MLDPSVKIVNTKSLVGFDSKTALPLRVIQVDFTVGSHGPFTITTPSDHFTEAYLEQETGKIVSTLRAAGAIT